MKLATSASFYLVENVRIHDTGSSAIKMAMRAFNMTFRNCEVYNAGARMKTYGHGIEGVQAYKVTVDDCYIHDLPGAGIHLGGGSSFGLIRRNFIEHTGFGINVGFAPAGYEYMDTINNPNLFENRHTLVASNILTGIYQAGINLWAAENATIIFNTLFNVQEVAQNAILLNSVTQITPSGSLVVGCRNVTVIGNILTKSKTARVGPIFQIRAGGLSPGSLLQMSSNAYYDAKGLSASPWRWGKGIMLEDERVGFTFVGNLTGWRAHCMSIMPSNGKWRCDNDSIEANPKLTSSFSLQSCSIANSVNHANIVAYDFNGRTRVGIQSPGAVSASSVGATNQKDFPPVPRVFSSIPPYLGMGIATKYYNIFTWPYDFWLHRTCVDIIVDSINGDDNQPFNYESAYSKPFKTINQAIISLNQCDRILLRGNQVHAGPFGIYRQNVTVMTHPDDNIRAVVKCDNIGSRNCIMFGDGFYDGAAAATLINFDIVMTGESSGDCIRLNEGYGGAYSPYWKFYIEESKRGMYDRGYTLIKNMDIQGCSMNGIKLSTFITGVVMDNLNIHDVRGVGVEMRNGNNVTIRASSIQRVGKSGIVMGGGSRNNVIENNQILNYGDRGILIGSDNTEVMYMDVDIATKTVQGSWHDAINCTVRNNVIAHGIGAGLAFYSARDIVAVHNTLLDVGMGYQGAILLNLSPKLIGPYTDVMLPNINITLANNIISLSPSINQIPMVELRIMQSKYPIQSPSISIPSLSDGNCTSKRYLRSGIRKTVPEDLTYSSNRKVQPHLATPLFVANTQGSQGRNSDGSCPQFPDTNEWHRVVTDLPVHPKSTDIKTMIRSGGSLHPDFGGGWTSSNHFIPYGIPFAVVDSVRGQKPQRLLPVKISSTGYASESDGPLFYPFPANVSVEGSYLNCPDAQCSGDRHVVVVDNATCTLYESWRSFPPGITKDGSWMVDIAVKFDLLQNKLRPLGFSSSDAAGLPVLPGLVQFDELINKGVIRHALRFTGPNSRAGYSFPATHFAPTGDTGSESPWMGMRVRLNANYSCSTLARAARIFCVALQTYGGIFADNGSPWYFSGEATTNWAPYLSELQDIKKIPISAIEVVDTGCICLDAECTVADCGNGVVNANALPVASSVVNASELHFHHNIYYVPSAKGRYVDRKVGSLGKGFDGDLLGWKKFIKGDIGSIEQDPRIDSTTFRPSLNNTAVLVPQLPNGLSGTDFYGRPVVADINGLVTAGALLVGTVPQPTIFPTKRPRNSPSESPSRPPEYTLPTALPTIATSEPSKSSQQPSRWIDTKIPTSIPSISGLSGSPTSTKTPSSAISTNFPSYNPDSSRSNRPTEAFVPSTAPVSNAPTRTVVTMTPSFAPVSGQPTRTAETKAPTNIPSTLTPSGNPITTPPTNSPSSRPSQSPINLLTFVNDGMVNNRLYNSSYQTEISTQYNASYNYFNGMSYYSQNAGPSFIISDKFDSQNTSFRLLLKFDDIHKFVPQGTSIVQSGIQLTFTNWNNAGSVDACVMTKPWEKKEIVKYRGTGWRFNRWNSATSQSELWTRPGGWQDCDSRFAAMKLSVPGSGTTTARLILSPLVINLWLANNGGANFGLLFKASAGKISLGSTFATVTSQRPVLYIQYVYNSSITTQPTILPATLTPSTSQIPSKPSCAPSRSAETTRMPTNQVSESSRSPSSKATDVPNTTSGPTIAPFRTPETTRVPSSQVSESSVSPSIKATDVPINIVFTSGPTVAPSRSADATRVPSFTVLVSSGAPSTQDAYVPTFIIDSSKPSFAPSRTFETTREPSSQVSASSAPPSFKSSDIPSTVSDSSKPPLALSAASVSPSIKRTDAPISIADSSVPTFAPSRTVETTRVPSNPISTSSVVPTVVKTGVPTCYPSRSPTLFTTQEPSRVSGSPITLIPTQSKISPSLIPSIIPSKSPVTREPSKFPTCYPSLFPLRQTSPTFVPSSFKPSTRAPSKPTMVPSTRSPSTRAPSRNPSSVST